MPTLADVIGQHGPAYEQHFGASLLPSHTRALRDIVRCRSPTLGGHLMQCADCGYRHLVYHSCRNRACATCGAERAAAWCQRQRALLLPVSYFHVVFTVPAELRQLVRAHQKALIAVLFKAAFASLSALCADPRHLGGTIGALAVLHTWTRTLQWHPHVHLLVPGGALSPHGRWIRAKRRLRKPNKPYLVPARALSVKFWGQFLELARRALPGEAFPDMPSKQHWVVDIKPVLQEPERVIDYLGRYIQRTAISDGAIVDCDQRQVTFRYRDSRDGRSKLMSLPGQEFVRRFLQHVLPRGVHRVRAFGLLHPSKRTTLQRLQLLLTKRTALPEPVAQTRAEPSPCRQCGAVSWKRGPRLSPQQCEEVLAELELTAHAVSARGPPVEMTELQ